MIDEDVQTLCMDLPATIRSYVASNNDGSYTIVLNARLNHERLMEAYAHEIAHICHGDYEKKCGADLIEIYSHRNV